MAETKAKQTTKKPEQKKEKRFTPQQIDFAMRYYLPNSPTYGNALQSALKAGFSETYAKNITVFDLKWLEDIVLEIIGEPTDKKNLVAKSKRVLNRSLDSKNDKLAQDTAKFIAMSDREFSLKQDITSGDEKITIALTEYVDGGDDSANSKD